MRKNQQKKANKSLPVMIIMALITSQGTARNIQTTDVVVTGIIPLRDDMCPKNKDTGEIIPKSLLKLADGTTIGVLTNAIANAPVAFPAEGISCKISYENVNVDLRERDTTGKLTGNTVKGDVSNVLNAHFDSKLRYIVDNAKSVSVAGVN